ncbi:type II secretion system F family protein [Nocardiopsis sp. EMB25]|uniref:type II secretion system F family protein n=1 Tax=Nocardiopsis sp. EMB25 TaxID=2835867 RepID=UPI0022838AA8|nr:type II secretion system F family protein [Nocardiopsis sp. EMB25]MCY9787108.1 type II secretion system F family protein [Nocardiopsis sp. EMB25]
MSVFVMSMAGALVGAGVYTAAYGMRRPTLIERLTPRSAPKPQVAPSGGWAQRLGHRPAQLLARTGVPGAKTRRTLAVAEVSVDAYRAEKAAATVLGVLLGTVVTTVGGSLLPLPLTAWVLAAGVAGACFLAPDLAAHQAAAKNRAELRAATSALADLVVMGLSSGAGTTGALNAALAYGTGPTPDRIRHAVHAATLRHRPVWEGLESLAEETGVRELRELAASLRGGGASGARTRSSLTAKASSLRARRLAEAEAAAHAATERMTLPTMGLVAGFLLLISYAALIQVMAGF